MRLRWLDIGQVHFLCVFIDRVEVHKLAKKERGQYQAILTEQAWSIKDLLYGFQGNSSCGKRQVVPSWQDSSILPITAQDLIHLARSQSWPYNKQAFCVIIQNCSTHEIKNGKDLQVFH